jgi:hypothetical protein
MVARHHKYQWHPLPQIGIFELRHRNCDDPESYMEKHTEERPMSEEKITQDEMVDLFGEEMPVQAVELLFTSSPEKTVGELRKELRMMSAKFRLQSLERQVKEQQDIIDELRNDRGMLNQILLDVVQIHRAPSGNFTARGPKGTFVHGTTERESDALYLRGCRNAICEAMGVPKSPA